MRAVAPNTALRPGIDFDSVGATPGTRATLVQFSSSFCAPCRSTRQILSDVAELVDGVTYVEIDAESHLELVREHQILRTPTTLVLDADGAVVVRASGQPRKADVIAALGRALDRSTTTSPTP
jgi:thiol-disulfide isomerase/thioredoxin